MTRERLTIQRLADHPSALPVAARWIWETWGTKTLAETIESLDDPENCPPTLVAMLGGRPVGVVGLSRFLRVGDTDETLWINAMYVVEVERSHGAGSLLLAAAVESAAPMADRLFVYTDVPEWYQQRGWSVVEREDHNVVLSRELSDES